MKVGIIKLGIQFFIQCLSLSKVLSHCDIMRKKGIFRGNIGLRGLNGNVFISGIVFGIDDFDFGIILFIDDSSIFITFKVGDVDRW